MQKTINFTLTHSKPRRPRTGLRGSGGRRFLQVNGSVFVRFHGHGNHCINNCHCNGESAPAGCQIQQAKSPLFCIKTLCAKHTKNAPAQVHLAVYRYFGAGGVCCNSTVDQPPQWAMARGFIRLVQYNIGFGGGVCLVFQCNLPHCNSGSTLWAGIPQKGITVSFKLRPLQLPVP